jgi:hypothetical protein
MHAARMREIGISHKILVGELEWKGPLARSRCRWSYNIKMYLKETRCQEYGLQPCGSELEPVEGSFEHVNEASGNFE